MDLPNRNSMKGIILKSDHPSKTSNQCAHLHLKFRFPLMVEMGSDIGVRREKQGGWVVQTGSWNLIQHPCCHRYFPPFLAGDGSQEAPANGKPNSKKEESFC